MATGFSATVTLKPVIVSVTPVDGMFDSKQSVSAPAMKERKPITIEFDGTFAKSMPLHLEGQGVDAYRDGSHLTFTDSEGVWQLQTTEPPMPGHADPESDSQGSPTVGSVGTGELWALYNIPAPHELLGHLDTQKANFQRAIDAGGFLSADDYIDTTVLEGTAIPACCVNLLGNAGPAGMHAAHRHQLEGGPPAYRGAGNADGHGEGSRIEERRRDGMP